MPPSTAAMGPQTAQIGTICQRENGRATTASRRIPNSLAHSCTFPRQYSSSITGFTSKKYAANSPHLSMGRPNPSIRIRQRSGSAIRSPVRRHSPIDTRDSRMPENPASRSSRTDGIISFPDCLPDRTILTRQKPWYRNTAIGIE